MNEDLVVKSKAKLGLAGSNIVIEIDYRDVLDKRDVIRQNNKEPEVVKLEIINEEKNLLFGIPLRIAAKASRKVVRLEKLEKTIENWDKTNTEFEKGFPGFVLVPKKGLAKAIKAIYEEE